MNYSPALSAAVLTALITLTACDGGPVASRPARDHSTELASIDAAPREEGRAERASFTTERAPRREEPSARGPVQRVAGKPMWADNRRYSADENARYQFEQHGDELNAASLGDFVAKAHRFVNTPPDGAMTLTRSNGDRLLYDPKSQLFGVVRDDGAPRTVFKPDDGEAYWAAQVEREGRSSQASSRRARDREG